MQDAGSPQEISLFTILLLFYITTTAFLIINVYIFDGKLVHFFIVLFSSLLVLIN